MKFKLQNDLLAISIITGLLILLLTFLPSTVLRIILGLPFILFFPGYTLLAALFAKRNDLDGIERVALSFGLSIAVVPLIGLILNYTPWGIRLEPVLYSVASFIFITSIIAWLRRRRLPEQEQFGIEFRMRVPGWGGGTWDKALSAILVLTILGTLGTLGYVIANPKVGERFTEFYILGLSGNATDYPEELVVGEEGKVILGIINREHEAATYWVEVVIDGVKNNEVGPVELEHDGKWEGEIGFTPQKAGEGQKAEFVLYKQGEDEPYSSLHLWLDVKDSS